MENCELAIVVKSSLEKPFLLRSKHYAVLYLQLNTPQPCANCGVLNDLIHAEITKQSSDQIYVQNDLHELNIDQKISMVVIHSYGMAIDVDQAVNVKVIEMQESLWSACVSVDNSKLVKWINYLIDNVCIKVGSKVYRQTVGIPMGTDCAPQLANLFLFHYEYSYMKILMKKNLCVAKKFNDTIRYIDALLTVNNYNSKFEKEICNIYPPELTLKRT